MTQLLPTQFFVGPGYTACPDKSASQCPGSPELQNTTLRGATAANSGQPIQGKLSRENR